MGRPKLCNAVFDRMKFHRVTTPGVLVVNGPLQADEYLKIELPDNWQLQLLPENIGMMAALTKVFTEFPNEPWYGIATDNEYVYTDHFDQILVKAAGSYGISHGNDGVKNKPITIHTYAIYGGELLRLIGYWPIPGTFHAFSDWAWQLIGTTFNLIFPCDDVITQHKDIAYGRADVDETHITAQSHAARDFELYEQWKEFEWPQLRKRLAAKFVTIPPI